MKGIKIDNKLILREMSRSLNRDLDVIAFELSLEVLQGIIVNKELIDMQHTILLIIEKSRDIDSWYILKDSTNAAMMSYIENILNTWKNVYTATAPKPIYKTVVDPDKGELKVVIGQEEESEEFKTKEIYENTYQNFKKLFEKIQTCSMVGIEI